MIGLSDVCIVDVPSGVSAMAEGSVRIFPVTPISEFQHSNIFDEDSKQNSCHWNIDKSSMESFGSALRSLGEKIGGCEELGVGSEELGVGSEELGVRSEGVRNEELGGRCDGVGRAVNPFAAAEHTVNSPELKEIDEFDEADNTLPITAAVVSPSLPMPKIESHVVHIKKLAVPTPTQIVVAAAEAVVETIAVSSTLSTTGEGEIHIQLKSDVLDGSFVKLQAKDGDLKIIVTPGSKIAEEIFVKNQETFQLQLSERVATWRINVGVAAWSERSVGRKNLEDKA
jgi:hypothetical protein